MTDLVPPTDPESWVERQEEEKRDRNRNGTLRFGFQVYIPSRSYSRSHPRSPLRGQESVDRTQISWAEPRWQERVSRGGTGYVCIGNHLVDPEPFWKAIHELHGLQSSDHELGKVGFEWWVEHTASLGGFTLRAGYFGEVELKTRPSYADHDRYSVYRVEDLVRAFALLGYLEQEGPQSLAPAAEWRPTSPEPQAVSPDPGQPEGDYPQWVHRLERGLRESFVGLARAMSNVPMVLACSIGITLSAIALLVEVLR